MNKKYYKNWLKAAVVRATKTFSQSLIATIGVGVAFNDVDWKMAGSIALTAFVLSMLTSVTGLPELDVNEKGDLVYNKEDNKEEK